MKRLRWFRFLCVFALGCSGCREQVLSPLDKEPMQALAQHKPRYKLDNHGRVMELRLEIQSIDEKILETIQKLGELRDLNLNGTDLTDDGLAKLAVLEKLQTLRLDETHITDTGLLPLETLEDLRLLAVKKCKTITSLGVEKLKRRLPDLNVYQ